MTDIDPTILAIFGPVPAGTGLNENPTAGNDVAVAVLLGIATVAVVLRLWCRRYTSTPLKADDSVIVAALLLTYATGGMSFAAGHFGAGRHVWTVTAVDVSMAAKVRRFRSCVARLQTLTDGNP
jgi:nitrate reductase gamma subunit